MRISLDLRPSQARCSLRLRQNAKAQKFSLVLHPARLMTPIPLLRENFSHFRPRAFIRLGEGVDRPDQAVLAFLLSSYSYAHTARSTEDKPRLCAPQALDVTNVLRIADAIHFGRRLVNTPANDMGPDLSC
jgi:hypothetical protein